MTDAQLLELKLLVGGKAFAAFVALPDDEQFDLAAALVAYGGNMHLLAAAMLRALCADASEQAVGEVSGKERIKLGPLEIEEAGSTGGVQAARAENWCAEAERMQKLGAAGADMFAPSIDPWWVP